MRKFFGKFVSVTLAAAVIAMFALSSDDKWCSRVDKAFDESALGSFLNESKAGYGRYATGLPGQAASVLADSGENGENGENGGNGGNGGTEQDIGQTADTASTHRATDRDYEETDKISDGISVEGVYACGRLTGIYEQTEGVLVVNTTEVTDEDGKKVNPADKKVQCGDYILSVNGRTVADKEELSEAVNDIMKQYDERHEDKSTVNIKFLRGGEKMSADITPVRMDDGRYYMGIWVKDDLAGIGTITYYTKDGRFGALGHGIGDGTQSGNLLYANSGDLYSMKLTKIKKGKSGAPGDLVQVAVVALAIEVEQRMARRHAAVALFGQRRAHHGVAFVMTDVRGVQGSAWSFVLCRSLRAREAPAEPGPATLTSACRLSGPFREGGARGQDLKRPRSPRSSREEPPQPAGCLPAGAPRPVVLRDGCQSPGSSRPMPRLGSGRGARVGSRCARRPVVLFRMG